ncbi:hypothetical protein [Paenibacillus durus]|uniref:Uncharacterized protein n=1 Tax=Paenibacillus durus TaxID=44251 RepID=A0A089HVF0_PAEDU|nr:hypothetical protein [Paenibacillus durus]AIQ15067.1 hypothetical protein PDUR_26730 [Paenibacillus durus]
MVKRTCLTPTFAVGLEAGDCDTKSVQFFGGSVSVAVCGLLLHVQRNAGPASAYQHVYWLLLTVSLVSLGLVQWYRRGRARAASDDERWNVTSV